MSKFTNTDSIKASDGTILDIVNQTIGGNAMTPYRRFDYDLSSPGTTTLIENAPIGTALLTVHVVKTTNANNDGGSISIGTTSDNSEILASDRVDLLSPNPEVQDLDFVSTSVTNITVTVSAGTATQGTGHLIILVA